MVRKSSGRDVITRENALVVVVGRIALASCQSVERQDSLLLLPFYPLGGSDRFGWYIERERAGMCWWTELSDARGK